MNRTTLSLIAGASALAAVTGLAAVTAPDASGDASRTSAAVQAPVERTSLLCPAPSTSDLAETTYTSFTPVTEGAGDEGTAALTPAGADVNGADDGKKATPAKPAEPVLKPGKPGTPVEGETTGGDTPAMIGTADGLYAPGWTVQQTTEVAAGAGRGLLGVNCTPADTDFWFPGASTAEGRTDYVHLTNPDDSAALVDIELYGEEGELQSTVADGITVPPRSTEPVLLSTLTDAEETGLTVHLNVRGGRIGAAVEALDDELGGDWLSASADPAANLVIPGIPKDATEVTLVAFTPGDADADLNVRLAAPSGAITPAGHETLRVKSGMTTSADLGDVTRGEPGSLVLTPTDRSVPVVAAARVVRGKGDSRETAFIPATRAVGARSTSVAHTEKGATLSLTAPDGTAKVRVTASAGTGGGEPVTKTYTVEGGTTQDVEAPVPSGLEGTYALTVETVSGGPVHAARTLTATRDGVPAFTVQTLPDDRGMVAVPEAEQDLSVLQR
ncbi:DUF5719 family protein [Streptomyces sp. NPDC006610]|uniref:DUF5719 family protein n=1 Tax=Streptomyces sp. NPDC006610 TaxID=3154584 RepID=UPI0033AB3067